MSAVPLVPPRRRVGHPLLRYLARRIAIGLLLAVAVSILVFAVTQVLPGDPADAILGRNATPASKAALRQELGLDRSIPAQYASWATGILHGDLGTSLASGQPVGPLLRDRLSNTLALAFATLAVIIPLAVALGTLAGVRAGRSLDHAITGMSLAVIAVPEFVTGTVLAIVVAVQLGLVPPVSLLDPGVPPLAQPDLLLLPVATLTLAGAAYLIRMVRAGVLEAMRSDYVQMARLNGLSERRVIWRHALPNSLATTVQVIAATVQWLVGGVVVVESVFQYPGLGIVLVQAVASRDIPVVQATAILVALVYIGVNILADIAVVLLIPRLRTGGGV